VGCVIENKHASLGSFSPPGGIEPKYPDAFFPEAMHLRKAFRSIETTTEIQPVSPYRSSERATVIDCHRPPRDVSTPRRTAAKRIALSAFQSVAIYI
jgi:hypothetical protein